MSDKEVVSGVTGRDLAALGFVALLIAPPVVAAGAGRWREFCEWCAEQRVLLPAESDPLVVVPESGGVGLDAQRIVIAVLTIVVVSLLIGFIRRRWQARRRRRVA